MTNFDSIPVSALDTVTGGSGKGLWEATKMVGRGIGKATEWGLKGADWANTAMDMKQKLWDGGDKDKK